MPLFRAYKQVKNWFSNERQKNKEGRWESMSVRGGGTVKLRPLSVDLASRWPELPSQWSDEFFEEVLMIYDFVVLTHLRAHDPSA